MTEMQKQAMWKGFYDELDKIAFQTNVEKMAQAHFAKVARALSTKSRNKLSEGAFVYPAERRYPIHDLAHARNALARSSGKPEEGKVRAAVHARYPELKKTAGVFDWLGKKAVEGAKPHAIAAVKQEASKLRKPALLGAGAVIGGSYLAARAGAKHGTKKALRDHASEGDFYKTGAKDKKKDDPWSRHSDSFLSRHKGKLMAGGLALATAAGVGHKVYKSPGMKARRRVTAHAEFWKKKGGYTPKKLKEVVVNNTDSKDIPANAARVAEAKVRGKKQIEVRKQDVAHADAKGHTGGKNTEHDGRSSASHLTAPELKALERGSRLTLYRN